MALGLDVGERELDLAVDAAGPDQRRVQLLRVVARHDDDEDAERGVNRDVE